MNSPLRTLFVLTLFAVASVPTIASSPDGESLLRQMSQKISSAKSFRLCAERFIDPALTQNLPTFAKAKVCLTVSRPGKLIAHVDSPSGKRQIVVDGRSLTLYDSGINSYAAVPVPSTLDAVVKRVDERYGFTPPLADFVVSNVEGRLKQNAQTITYDGRSKVGGIFGLGGTPCHLVSLHGPIADAQIWIGVGDSLPRKLTAIFHRPGNPQVEISFNKWNLSPEIKQNEFTFVPPEKAEKIEMLTTMQMKATEKQTAR